MRLNDWKTTPIFSLRIRAIARSPSRVTSVPSTTMRPEVGESRPARIPSRVDFPDPETPVTPWQKIEGNDVPVGHYTVPLGKARVARAGAEVTVLAYGTMVHVAVAAAEATGVDAEVVDLRTLWPLDREAILDSVARTSRVLVLQEASRSTGVANAVCSLIAAEAFEQLDAPPAIHAPIDTPVPFAPELEDAYLPSTTSLEEAIRELLAY